MAEDKIGVLGCLTAGGLLGSALAVLFGVASFVNTVFGLELTVWDTPLPDDYVATATFRSRSMHEFGADPSRLGSLLRTVDDIWLECAPASTVLVPMFRVLGSRIWICPSYRVTAPNHGLHLWCDLPYRRDSGAEPPL